MWFLAIGVVLLLLKLAAVAPVVDWSWLIVLAPFGLAMAWWAWADSHGYTQKKVMERLDEKKAARREKALQALGQSDKQRRR